MEDLFRIVEKARHGRHVVGWKLDRRQREELLRQFPPRYSRTVADHVTLKAKVAADTPQPSFQTAAIIGRGDDDAGVEAMVVALAGSTERPGGGTFHITWSLEAGRFAKESNELLKAGSWTKFVRPVPVKLIPGTWA